MAETPHGRLGGLGQWRQGEAGRTMSLFLYLALVVGSFITARVARDALFLSRYDIGALPYMYAWVALAMVLAGAAYSRVADRFRHHSLGLALTAGHIALVLVLRGLVAWRLPWVYPVLYVFVEIMGGLLTIQFWTFAHDVFDTRQAKRLFGIVGAGGVVASVVVGLTIGGVGRVVGADNLLLVCAALLLACLVLQVTLRRIVPVEAPAPKDAPAGRRRSLLSDWTQVFSVRHMRWVAWITVLTFVVVTVVDFQFKVVARYAHLNRENELAAFLGTFHGVCGLVSILVQVLLTGRLITRWGVARTLAVMPTLLLMGTAVFLVVPALWSVTLLRGTDSVLRYTVHDAASQVLYLPLSGRWSGRARAFVDGVLKHLAQGMAGLAIAILAPRLDPHVEWLGFGSVVCLLPWLGATWTLRREYVRALSDTLDERRRVSTGTAISLAKDEQALGLVRETLAAPDEHHVLHALEILPFIRRQDWSQDLDRLLEHESPRIRQEALRLMAHENATPFLERIRARMEDADPGVRSEAVGTYCSMLQERALPRVERFLDDESFEVRSAAISGFLRFGGLDGILAAAEPLKVLLQAPQAEARGCGTRVVGQSGIRSLYRNLLPLLDDPDHTVRVHAVEAAGRLGSSELLLPLLQRLADRHTRRAAVQAIAEFGTRAYSTLRIVLANPREDPNIRRQVPRVLSRIGEQGSLDLLTRALEDQDASLRYAALQGIVSLRARFPSLRADRESLRRLLHTELKQVYQFQAILCETEPLQAELLKDCLENLRQQALDRVWLLLRSLFPEPAMESALRNLASPHRTIRANALEVLENLLDEENRRCVVPLLETQSQKLLKIGDGLFVLMHRDGPGWLRELLGSGHAWTVVCALDAIRRSSLPGFSTLIRGLLGHPETLVREEAQVCMNRSDVAREPPGSPA